MFGYGGGYSGLMRHHSSAVVMAPPVMMAHTVVSTPVYGGAMYWGGWADFHDEWADAMHWMAQDIYMLWRRWQRDISGLNLSREQQRQSLEMLVRRSGVRGYELEEIVDLLLDTTRRIGADEYGHAAGFTERSTTTTRSRRDRGRIQERGEQRSRQRSRSRSEYPGEPEQSNGSRDRGPRRVFSDRFTPSPEAPRPDRRQLDGLPPQQHPSGPIRQYNSQQSYMASSNDLNYPESPSPPTKKQSSRRKTNNWQAMPFMADESHDRMIEQGGSTSLMQHAEPYGLPEARNMQSTTTTTTTTTTTSSQYGGSGVMNSGRKRVSRRAGRRADSAPDELDGPYVQQTLPAPGQHYEQQALPTQAQAHGQHPPPAPGQAYGQQALPAPSNQAYGQQAIHPTSQPYGQHDVYAPVQSQGQLALPPAGQQAQLVYAPQNMMQQQLVSVPREKKHKGKFGLSKSRSKQGEEPEYGHEALPFPPMAQMAALNVSGYDLAPTGDRRDSKSKDKKKKKSGWF
ncbi:hypothetical protein AMS68_004505 [Peltaster fructicola]|uniref:Uncharacterized protein n=1 Tax=Peltaster fructicola TaxID=286661 RepID=A0A6H0XWL4_9PEZI|nr:hypothetical protein AMS68_004505 [Peltaster fructicola]